MTVLLQPPLADFTRILGAGGVLAGLAFLNGRVTHRCTAIYRLEAMTVRNLYLFDREGSLLPESLGVVPLGDSFCQHAMREGAFLTDDTRGDSRVDGSPFKGVVVAYHGLPLLDARGELFGTLCHFDFVPRPLPDGEFEFLQNAARVLPAYLK
ncbi:MULTISPECIES: GAF domain-containing protein [unclassified Polaromonas]|uniref:GAF domain-containing protein n=1 Tax=unclassified Polaromonas TaxID=2638319 RepID=UPI00129EBCD7|nr:MULTISPECIES: GAF domain-containing protein [unclassified Polaromonas]QGJ18818.1 guanylate cyclase [Polaromonas sp. Pch-P]